MRVLLATLLALGLLAGCGKDEPAALPPLVEQLRAGGMALVMRHALTETAADEQESLRSCARQRNLTEAGRRQARAIGRAMRELGVPVGEVRASPLCRTRETAELAFGRARLDRSLITPGLVGTVEDDDRRARRLRRAVAQPPPPGLSTVLVTHTGNLGGAFGESVVEGEVLAFARGRLLGRIRPQAWPRLVRAARAARE